MHLRTVALIPALGCALWAQEGAQSSAQPTEKATGWTKTETATSAFLVPTGTKIPLGLINSVSTKSAAEGDRVYLETVFPILSHGRIVIPPGSYVIGTVTQTKRPGRVKGRGELFVRFDSLTLPNGVTRDFRARIGSLDGRATEQLNREEGKIRGDSNKGGDARTVGEATAIGASVGAIAGSAAGHAGMGVGIGAAAGATAGLVGVLMSRGPDAVLAKGTTLEMVLDRDLSFSDEEVNFSNAVPTGRSFSDGPGPVQNQDKRQGVLPRRYPLVQ
jgi:type IV secretion system protein VirB10